MPSANSIRFMVDFDQVATTIGAIEEAAQVANSDRYIGKLINAAHAEAAKEFDTQFVADAMASSQFKHMFEWGTSGINKGRGVHLNPNSDAAKLWEHVLMGSGKNKSVGFRFQPSKVPVPLPTESETGISEKYLSKLSGKHIFWNKAAVMESGTPVHIAPKAGGKLFIPLGQWSGPNVRPVDKARGFIMTRNPVIAQPGAATAGTFTAYWERFWQGRGQEIMQDSMENTLSRHLDRVRRKAESVRGNLAPASAGSATRAAARGRALGAKVMEQAASEEKIR